jgi:hypothetical protein
VTDLKVVPLRETTIRDIPAMARHFADAVENGEYGKVTAAITVTIDEDGGIGVFGWGDTNEVHTVGVLSLALGRFSANRYERR